MDHPTASRLDIGALVPVDRVAAATRRRAELMILIDPSERRRLHAETAHFVAAGDIEGLAAALRADVSGLAARLADRHRRADVDEQRKTRAFE